MRSLLLCIIMLCSSLLIAQARLTSYQSNTDKVITYYQKAENGRYIIEILEDDFVEVYFQSELMNRQFLHRTYIKHSYTTRNLRHKLSETHLFVNQYEGVVGYDFTNDQSFFQPVPNNWEVSVLREVKFDSISISVREREYETPFSAKRRNYLICKSDVKLLNELLYDFVDNDLYLTGHIDRINNRRYYSLVRYEDLSEIELTSHSDFNLRPLVSKGWLYFADGDGIYRFSLKSETKEKLVDYQFYTNNVEFAKIGNILCVIESNGEQVTLRRYSISDMTLLGEYVTSISYSTDVQVHLNYLFITSWNQSDAIDLTTGERISLDTSFDNYSGIGDTVLLRVVPNFRDGQRYFDFEILNLVTKETRSFGSLSYWDFQGYEVNSLSQFGNDYFLQLNSRIDGKNYYILESETGKVERIQWPRNNDFGFSNDAYIFVLNNHIYLVDDDLYILKGDNLNKLNSGRIQPFITGNNIKIENDKIHWVELEPHKIFSFDGEQKRELCSLESFDLEWETTLYDFAELEECIYFFGFGDSFFRYDKSTKNIERIEQFVGLDRHYRVRAIDNVAYLYHGRDNVTLFSIDSNNDRRILLSGIREGGISLLDDALFKFKGDLYTLTDDGLYKIEQGVAMKVIELNNNPIHSNSQIIHPYDDNLLVLFADDGVYTYDGNKSNRIIAQRSAQRNFNMDGSFVFSTLGADLRYYHYEPNSETLSTLESVEDIVLKSTLIINGLEYSVCGNTLYSSNDGFVQPIFENFTADLLGIPNILDYYSHAGLVSVNDSYICIDKKGAAVELSNLRCTNSRIITQDSVAYFLGSEPAYGNQLYKMDFKEQPNDHEDLSYTIYPNPTSDYLELSEPLNDFQYELINSVGTIIKTGIIQQGPIDIKGQNPGIYFLKISKDGLSKSKPIVISP